MRLEELEQAVDAMVWRSWTAVGVSGWSGEGTATVVDVEPLIAFTALATGSRDPRLGREVLAWVAANVDLVSVRQFKHVVRLHGWDDDPQLATWAAALRHSTGRAWPGPSSAESGERELLDRMARARSGPARMSGPAATQLRLRALLGVGARAEVVRVLLTGGAPLSLAELASRIHYTRRQISSDVNFLVRSGVVVQRGGPGADTLVLARPDALEALLAPVGRWAPWAPALKILHEGVALLARLESGLLSRPEAEVARAVRELNAVVELGRLPQFDPDAGRRDASDVAQWLWQTLEVVDPR